jgi:RNA polymerase sigma-70 factor (ECF subfamily)
MALDEAGVQKPIEEQALLTRAREGDQAAYGRLIDSYRPRLEAFCYRFLHDADLARDAAQETYLRSYRNLHALQASAAFSTWLYKIARHYCLNLLRGNREGPIPWQDLSERVAEAPDVAHSIQASEQSIFHSQLLQEIKTRAASRKPPWQRCNYLIFEAYYLEEKRSLPQVAAILGKNVHTVQDRFYHHIKPVLEEIGQSYRAP